MTHDEIALTVQRLVQEQLGGGPMQFLVGAPTLQEHLGCTSLDTVAIQVAIEEHFGLKFGSGASDRGAIDKEWDACTSLLDVVHLVERWRGV